jgi:two-component system, sensor histidine kinase and response regulator
LKTILLIDDDEQVRDSFGLALRHKGYHVLVADSGRTGLEMAAQHLPDLILTDIDMPGGDGSTLLRNLRRDPALRSKQVVMMTGRPDLVTPRKGMEEGADDFLLKPVSFEALAGCIEARFKRASISWRVEEQMLNQIRSSVPPNLPHEFFTPLTGIIGLMEILRSDSSNLEAAEISEIHSDVYRSALRLHHTLRNYLLILDLQAPSPGPAPLALSPHEVEEGIRAGVEAALRLSENQDAITIRVKACSISVKQEDLSHMVEELVDNACKFSRKGTPVTVELGVDGRLIVTDEGRGLTPEEIDRIGAFQQFDRKKYEQQGLGLGLVLVQRLALQYRAEFSMKSQPGKGTQVQISFPLTDPA